MTRAIMPFCVAFPLMAPSACSEADAPFTAGQPGRGVHVSNPGSGGRTFSSGGQAGTGSGGRMAPRDASTSDAIGSGGADASNLGTGGNVGTGGTNRVDSGVRDARSESETGAAGSNIPDSGQGSVDSGSDSRPTDAARERDGATTGTGGSPGVPAASVRCISIIPSGVSGDGRVVVGKTGPPYPAAIWKDGVETALPCPDDGELRFGNAVAASHDGSVVVGSCIPGAPIFPYRAFRWTAATGLVLLGERGPSSSGGSAASDVSDDGSVVVGFFYLPGDAGSSGPATASVWTGVDGFRTDIPLDRGMAVSGDGKVLLGMHFANIPGVATADVYTWSEAAGLKLATNSPMTIAADLRTDGLVAFGLLYDPRYTSSYRMTSQGIQYLPCSVRSCSPGRTNGDGSILVGNAFVWDTVHGTRTLDTFVRSYALKFTQPFLFTDVSDDGTVFVGYTTDATNSPAAGFVMTLPESPVATSDGGANGAFLEAGAVTTVSCGATAGP